MPETLDSLARQYIGNEEVQLVSNANNTFSSSGLPIQPRSLFFKALETWEAAPALQSLWIVLFDIPKIVTDEVMKGLGEQPAGYKWNVDGTYNKLFTHSFQKLMGCVIAQDVGVPGESISYNYVGTNNRGFIQSPVIEYRNSYKPLQISFLETNVSIVDSIIRPWNIISSHLGNIARSGVGKYQHPAKTDIFVINLARMGTELEKKGEQIVNKRGLIPRKIWTFHNCFPAEVDEEAYTYETGVQLTRRRIPFVYQRYQVQTPQQSIQLADQINGTYDVNRNRAAQDNLRKAIEKQKQYLPEDFNPEDFE